MVADSAFVDDPAARLEMALLARRFGLRFVMDPGGGEFWSERTFPYGRCRITVADDRADLEKLKEFLRTTGDLPRD